MEIYVVGGGPDNEMPYILNLIGHGYKIEGIVRTIEMFRWKWAECCLGSLQWVITGHKQNLDTGINGLEVKSFDLTL